MVAVLSWLLLRSTEPKHLKALTDLRSVPDYFLRDFEITSMDEIGNPRYRLTASSMQHYSHDDSSRLVNPSMIVFDDELEAWKIKSDEGHLQHHGETLFLGGDVLITRLNVVRRDSMKISTRDLTVKTGVEYAETSQPVEIVSDLGITTAIGMQMYYKNRVLHLLNKVRGKYDSQ
ncbi:MAG: LPS export ABC transporter periplasmic protein LptC [Gammaproteobacteria bacterium]